jgi:uncharacterized membrane protein HdeD (DUF308 family)
MSATDTSRTGEENMSNQTDASVDPDGMVPSVGLAENRPAFIALGLLLILVGVIAIGAPLATTVVVKVFAGWLMLITGIGHIVHAFFTRQWKAFFEDLLVGCLYTAVGIWLAFFPLAGIIGLTILLASAFVVDGILKFQMGFRLRPASGWFWMVLSGFIAVAAGVLLVLGLPSTATWAIGMVVGLNILMSGVAFLGMALMARSSATSA